MHTTAGTSPPAADPYVAALIRDLQAAETEERAAWASVACLRGAMAILLVGKPADLSLDAEAALLAALRDATPAVEPIFDAVYPDRTLTGQLRILPLAFDLFREGREADDPCLNEAQDRLQAFTNALENALLNRRMERRQAQAAAVLAASAAAAAVPGQTLH